MSAAFLLLTLLGADPEGIAPKPLPRGTQTVQAADRSDTIFSCFSGQTPHPVWLHPFKGRTERSLSALVIMCDPDPAPSKETKP